MNEADTCRTLVQPKLIAAGWDTPPHQLSEQAYFTDGCSVVAGTRVRRRPRKFAGLLLPYRSNFALGVLRQGCGCRRRPRPRFVRTATRPVLQTCAVSYQPSVPPATVPGTGVVAQFLIALMWSLAA